MKTYRVELETEEVISVLPEDLIPDCEIDEYRQEFTIELPVGMSEANGHKGIVRDLRRLGYKKEITTRWQRIDTYQFEFTTEAGNEV